MYYDAHCHYYSLNKRYDDFIIAAVSVDYETSLMTLNLKSEKILAGVGIHPWKVHAESFDKLKKVLNLIKKADFVGEIGLDFEYAKAKKEDQIAYLDAFLSEAVIQNKPVNLHALRAWKECFEIVTRKGVRKAIFHWYTGPEELLKDIEGAGYFITINPSVSFQTKHSKILEKAPLEIIITESDGGYEYRGKLLEPVDIIPTLKIISNVKGVDEEELKKRIEMNFRKVFS